jgi:hypothetical protein
MHLSAVEIAVRYGMTVGRLKTYIYTLEGYPPIASHRDSKYSNKKTALYDVRRVDSYFANLGIYPQPFDETEITLTQAAFILELSYDHAKKVLSHDGPKPISMKASGALIFNRKEIESFKAERDQELEKPVKMKPPEKYNKIIAEPSAFNTMAQAFIRAATEIRPRLATCGSIISRVRTDGEWGIGL